MSHATRPATKADLPGGAPERRRPLAAHLAPVAVWVGSAVYLGGVLVRGWVPHDEGMIAQTAERVLAGELPHRDFVELYTGGLAYAHALAFRLLGVSLVSPRLLLFALFLLWVPALYYVLARFARPVTAAWLTFLAVVWSVPCYPASLPSWYNLYLATFGTAALLRYVDRRRRRWLVVAGLCGGLSFLVKVVGLYFVAGALLFFVYREQCETGEDRVGRGGGRAYGVVVIAGLGLFVVALLALVGRYIDPPTAVHFVLPGTALAAALALREWRSPRADGGRRFARLLGEILPFLAGAAIPVALFFAWYASQGALSSLLHGVFVLPRLRLSAARFALPPLLLTLPFTGLLLLVLVPAAAARGREARWLAALLAVAGAAVIVLSATQRFVYLGVWLAIRLLPVILVVAGLPLLMPADSPSAGAGSPPDGDAGRTGLAGEVAAQGGSLQRQRVALALAMLATFTLLQYPFSSATYFNYVAPFVVVGAAAVASLRRPVHAAVGGVLVAIFILFAVLRIRPAAVSGVGFVYRPAELTGRLDGPRGGLRVRQRDADDVRRMVAAVAAHAPAGSYIYAAPDCPEVYFLSSTRNPTPTIYDLFDDPDGREARVLRAVDAHDVRVVVVNTRPQFSAAMSDGLADSLAARFPNRIGAGRYVVRWRE